MTISFDFGSVTAFHCGIFATFYFCAAFAILVYYRHIRGDIALALHSIASGFCHILIYISGMITPPSPHLYLAIACFCCAASPTILLCIREAIEPGWLTWRRYFHYIGIFLLGTLAAGIFAHEYIFYIMYIADLWFCFYACYKLILGINRHEKLIKQYYSELDSYSNNWVRYFVYYQVFNVFVFFFLYQFISETFNIIFNYIQAFYWLYFLLMCKKYRYYSRKIPEEVIEDNNTTTKISISADTVDFIDKRLEDLDDKKIYLDETLNLASLAQHVGTNRTYMSMYFRVKETTFWDYINYRRCEYAIQQIKDHPSYTMSTIAHNSGYKTENCFRTSFFTIFGKTPFVFKRELKLDK